jgi:hypothetical protein
MLAGGAAMMTPGWQCSECGYCGDGPMHMQWHALYHMRADALIMEVGGEASPTHYPIVFHAYEPGEAADTL